MNDNNIKPQRFQRKRLKGYKLPDGCVSVTRPGRWGNPFEVFFENNKYWILRSKSGAQDPRSFDTKEAASAEAVNLYKPWLAEEIKAGRLNLDDLRGKHIACYCAINSPCHGDYLLEIANQQVTMNAVALITKKLANDIPVIWDRFTSDDGFFVVYGWIARSDGQRDFLMISMDVDYPAEDVFFTTSSAKYSREIMKCLFGSDEDHNDCRKIEELYRL